MGQVDFEYYRTDSVWLAVALVNTECRVTRQDEIPDMPALKRFLAAHEVTERLTAADLRVARELRSELRSVFTADDAVALERLNPLLEKYNAPPRVVHDAERGFHLHFEQTRAGVGPWIGATTVLGLAFVLCDYGADRMGVCASSACTDVFIDTSKNRSKLYCSKTCAHRESVAAYRARQRPDVQPPPLEVSR